MQVSACVYVSWHVYNCESLCLSAHISMCTCLAAFGFGSRFWLCVRICECNLFHPRSGPFSWGLVYIYVYEVFLLDLFCFSNVPLQLCWDARAGMLEYSCALIFVPSRVSFPMCAIPSVSVFPCIFFPFPHLCHVQLPGFVHVRISLLLLSEGCIFNGVGADEIVHYFALYLSFSVFPMFA